MARRMRLARLPIAACGLLLPLLTTACLSPLVSRRAQVMEPGELEVAVLPIGAAWQRNNSFGPAAYARASARFGLVDRLDMQVVLDPSILPEVAFAYQFLGDPSRNDLALTFGVGFKPTYAALGDTSGGNLALPAQVLLDVPLGANTSLTLGARAVTGYVFGGSFGSSTMGWVVAPGASVGLSIEWGWFFVRPELAANGPLLLTRGAEDNVPPGLLTASLGIGAVFDFIDRSDAHR